MTGTKSPQRPSHSGPSAYDRVGRVDEADNLALTVSAALVEAIARRVAALVVEQGSTTVEAAPVAEARLTVPVAEAADLLGISVDHFRRHVLPELRIVRSGRLRLIPVSELECWIDQNAARALALEGC